MRRSRRMRSVVLTAAIGGGERYVMAGRGGSWWMRQSMAVEVAIGGGWAICCGRLLRSVVVVDGDQHSKVFTAKGTRDRRVRLAAHIAIQFYDVQDQLGYDQPSKAVDWLINKAKNAIAKLDELPEWNPIAGEPSTELGPEPTELPPSSCGYEFQLPKQMGENPSGSFDEEISEA
ncbi:hypothetical protein RJ640_018605 [Escallonia rubra]|uniref:TCP domain-containing protein n=1 Tax=Escallonia rubra TaxID=112253 RepID=A0AA88QFT0_9ASTE|nr:hypothetical protein RJ640_018605 [Escallonia rubra]